MQIYVLTRGTTDDHLTVGVYASAEAAMHYLELKGAGSRDDWEHPRSGSQVWQLRHGPFTYTIEAHTIWKGVDVDYVLGDTSIVNESPMEQ